MRYSNVCVCFFVGEMGDQLSTYATVGWMRGHPKWEQLCTGGGDVTPYVSHALTLSFSCFGSIFAL